MFKQVIALLLLLMPSLLAGLKEAPAEQLIRRLYVDLYGRIPTVKEFKAAEQIVGDGSGYPSLVEDMIDSHEFTKNLSWQIIRHYGPGIEEATVVPLERTRRHIEKNYLNKKTDLVLLLKDILIARGAEAYNPLVRFYAADDTHVTMATRMSERILGIPMGCAQCHDHKLYPELKQKEFWGLSAFFADTKIQHVGTKNQAKTFFDMVRKGGDKLGDQKIPLNTWLYNEQQGKSIFEEQKRAYYKQLPSASYYDKDEDEGMMEDNSDPLKAPQLVIFEEKKTSGQIKVYYEREEKSLKTTAFLPMKSRYSRSRGFPRENVAIWLTSPQTAKYLNRVTVNWVLNWLMGKSIKEPIVDIYSLDEYQEEVIFKFSAMLRTSGFNLHRFVKKVVLSEEYRQANSDAEKEGIYNSRNYRYLAGRHLVNTLYLPEFQQFSNMDESSRKFTNEAELELKKYRFMKQYFSNSLETGLYDSGSTKQALFTATNEIWLKYTEKIAREGYQSKLPVSSWIDDLYITLYSRRAVAAEKQYIQKLLNRRSSFENSNFYDVVWALVNSPEMRFY